MWAARLYRPAAAAAGHLAQLAPETDEPLTAVARPPHQYRREAPEPFDEPFAVDDVTRVARPDRHRASAPPVPQSPNPVASDRGLPAVPPPRRIPFSMAPTVIRPRATPPPLPLPPRETVQRQVADETPERSETGIIIPLPSRVAHIRLPISLEQVDVWGLVAAFASSTVGGALLLTAAAWIVGGG